MSRTKGKHPTPTIRPRPTYTTADQRQLVEAARRLGMTRVRVKVIRDYSEAVKSIRRRKHRHERQLNRQRAEQRRSTQLDRSMLQSGRLAPKQDPRPAPVREKSGLRSLWRRMTRRGS